LHKFQPKPEEKKREEEFREFRKSRIRRVLGTACPQHLLTLESWNLNQYSRTRPLPWHGFHDIFRIPAESALVSSITKESKLAG